MPEAPRKVGDEADGLIQLKTLLFRGEADRLRAVEASVEALDQRVGDAPRLEAATSEILVEALRRAEVARHRELATAIAPVVVASIRNEIQNSREMMVEALYPLTGQLVVAAVSNAFRDLIAAMNERLDRLTSIERWKLRVQARLTGKPVGELALSGQTRPRLLRVLFLERQSGALLASWRADGQPENRGELVGGLIAALTGFARDALGESGDLRTLDFGGRDIYVHGSPSHLIASEVDRQLRSEERASLDRDCLDWLAQYARDGKVDDRIFGDFIENALRRAVKGRKKRLGWPIRLVAAGLALLVLGFAARATTRAWRDHALQSALARVIAARPALAAFPIGVDTDHSLGEAMLHGLAPSREDADALATALRGAAGGYAIVANVGVIATEQSIAAEAGRVDAVRANLSNDIAALGRKIDALDKSSATVESLAAARAEQTLLARELSTTLSATGAGLADLRARAGMPRARLASLLDGFAIFFDRDQVIDRAGLNDRLDAIAKVLNQSDLGMRVIGYSDDSGNAAGNQTISRHRADLVADMLATRGVDRKRLSVLGRAASDPIAELLPGARERNRRVILEIADDGEIAP